MEGQPFYDVRQLADLLNVNKMTIYRLVERGDLRAYRIGRALRFRPSEVEEFLANQQTDAERSVS
jgi:putative molybdopterin biosynthesis protein